MLKKNIIIFYVTFITFFADRISKYYILKTFNADTVDYISITSFLNLNLVLNKGIAFGLLSFNEQFYYNILTVIIVLITSIVLFMAIKSSGIEKISFSLIFGGSLGNIFDRLSYSAVIDFIDIQINNFHWFIFNFADIFISLGVIILIILEIFKKKK